MFRESAEDDNKELIATIIENILSIIKTASLNLGSKGKQGN